MIRLILSPTAFRLFANRFFAKAAMAGKTQTIPFHAMPHRTMPIEQTKGKAQFHGRSSPRKSFRLKCLATMQQQPLEGSFVRKRLQYHQPSPPATDRKQAKLCNPTREGLRENKPPRAATAGRRGFAKERNDLSPCSGIQAKSLTGTKAPGQPPVANEMLENQDDLQKKTFAILLRLNGGLHQLRGRR